MGTAGRLGGYLAVLGLVFGAAWWAGTLTGVPDVGTPTVAAGDEHAGDANGADPETGPAFGLESAGLVSTVAGHTLVPRGPVTFEPGVPGELAFVVTGSGGRAVTAFDVQDERLLDLVVVRRDGTGFQHLQPTVDQDGVWRAPLTLPAGGVYRAYADFVPTGGPALVLGIDVFAPGPFDPAELPLSRAMTVAGYEVRLDTDFVAESTAQVFVTIDRNRLPVRDLEPYLGGLGHLVVLRQSDMSYLRVAPAPPGMAPAHRTTGVLAFDVDIPAAGGHRMFVEFQHAGVVHMAEFTVRTGSGQ